MKPPETPLLLRFNQPHKSILSFQDIHIPKFTLITGLNGSGKTHLLEAIANRSILLDVSVDGTAPNASVGYIKLSDLDPKSENYMTGESIRREQTVWQDHAKALGSLRADYPRSTIMHRAYHCGIMPDVASEPHAVAQITREQLIQIHGSEEKGAEAYRSLRETIDEVERNFLGQINKVDSRTFLVELGKQTGKLVFELTDRDAADVNKINWGVNYLFGHSFTRLFVIYRDAYVRNKLLQMGAAAGKDVSFISDEEFIQVYGPPPWDSANEALDMAGMNFHINKPDIFDYSGYQPHFIRKDTGRLFGFDDLSSGEKILTSLAFCVFYSRDERQPTSASQILLLDEVDAPLHPSMSKQLIAIIKNVLIGHFGCSVIATTHSPSTVALAEEGDIFLMDRGLHKMSKAEALNSLTADVPTLSINYEGRRQVFVESPADALNFSAIYEIVKENLPPGRSLQFIATGTKSKAGTDSNTGCALVRHLVNQLVDSGNTSVFGLIDWDGVNEPNGRIVVLGVGRRNGIENIILDPLLIAALICRDCSDHKAEIGVDRSVNYPSFLAAPKIYLQDIVRNVAVAIFGEISDEKEVEYFGGLRLLIDDRFLKMDDHELEELIIKRFQFLNRVAKKQAGRLMNHIVSSVIADQPEFMPVELHQALQTLLEMPAHIPGEATGHYREVKQ